MSFPRMSSKHDSTKIVVEQKFLVEKVSLRLDREKCTGCGQCSTVCPKDAIIFHHAPTYYKENPNASYKDIIKEIDADSCVYCGTCVLFCPFDAIFLYKNNEIVLQEEFMLVQNKSIPEIQPRKVKCQHIKRDIQKYWDGEITVEIPISENEEDKEKFLADYKEYPESCNRCRDICPADAITVLEPEVAWNKKQVLEIDDELCVKCGACMNVCPEEHISVKWNCISFKGAYNAIFWDKMHKKLLNFEIFTDKQ